MELAELVLAVRSPSSHGGSIVAIGGGVLEALLMLGGVSGG
jgi:hypothetical protein